MSGSGKSGRVTEEAGGFIDSGTPRSVKVDSTGPEERIAMSILTNATQKKKQKSENQQATTIIVKLINRSNNTWETICENGQV
jgi:hypothetical protein